jgi:hypothetical protein
MGSKDKRGATGQSSPCVFYEPAKGGQGERRDVRGRGHWNLSGYGVTAVQARHSSLSSIGPLATLVHIHISFQPGLRSLFVWRLNRHVA